MNRTISALVSALGLLAAPLAAKPQLDVLVNQIVPAQHPSLSRVQIFGRGYAGMEGYYLLETANDGSYVYQKLRAQTFPVKGGHAHLGAAVQRVDLDGDSYWQAGPGLRLQRSASESFARIDLRYFPQERHLNAYGFLDTKKWFADIEMNHKGGALKLNPGIDYKISKHVLIGVENLARADGSSIRSTYTGLRLGVTF